jgi:hypothetical protein
MEKHTTKITSKSIEQSGQPSDYKKAIAEYIWNGFDAKAYHIDIDFKSNQLGFLESFSITDDGEGISLETIDETFGYFLDSQKITTYENDGFVKGRKGKGRFAFNMFANKAIWETRFETKENKIFQYSIHIDRSSQKDFNIGDKAISHSTQTGTTVLFKDFFSLTGDLLECKEFESFICGEFGWFLFLNKEKEYSIKINGKSIDFWSIIDDFEEFNEQLGEYVFKISFLRWRKKIGDKYFYYFLNENKKETARKHTLFNNKAIDFHHSVYVESDYFNDFVITEDDVKVFDFAGKNQTDIVFKNLFKKLNQFILDKEKQFIRELQAEKLINEYHQKKVFPLFRNNTYEQYRQKDLENVVRELYCVQPKIFQGLKKEQSKTIVGFLNLLLDTDQRENVLTIIDNVIQLTDEEREALANSLKKTNLSQITKIVNLLSKRFETIQILKSLVFDLDKFANEREHLQKVIENNYWLFGEQYHIVSADENFEIALNNYLYYIENAEKLPEKINDKKKLKRPDIFICRKSNILDSENNEYTIEENIIVELKRPKIIIGQEQYLQVENYLRFIKGLPQFNSQLRRWKFILIGKTVDSYITDKYESQKLKGKRFLVESIQNYEIYALTWDDVFRTFDGRHKYLIDKLEFKDSIIDELENKGYKLDKLMANEITKIAVNQ